MALRMLLSSNDVLLRSKSKDVKNFDTKLHELLDDLAETMTANDGVGLAAIQIGILRKCLVVNVGEGVVEVVNPVLLSQEGEQIGFEGCLSFPNEISITRRPMKIKLKYFDRFGKEKTLEAEGLLAKALSHEVDHLNGDVFKTRSIYNLNSKELELYSNCDDTRALLNELVKKYNLSKVK